MLMLKEFREASGLKIAQVAQGTSTSKAPQLSISERPRGIHHHHNAKTAPAHIGPGLLYASLCASLRSRL